jgi:hypothetical protein
LNASAVVAARAMATSYIHIDICQAGDAIASLNRHSAVGTVEG